MNIKNMPVVDVFSAADELGIDWKDFAFVEMVENGSYHFLGCSDDALEEYEKEYEWRINHLRNKEAIQMKNQINLIKLLREKYNIIDDVLIEIYW